MSIWGRLRRDLIPDKRTLIVIVSLTILWYLFLLTRTSAWQPIVVAAWAWLPMAFLPIIAAVSGVGMLHHELTRGPHDAHQGSHDPLQGAPHKSEVSPVAAPPTKGIIVIISNLIIVFIRLLAYSALVFLGGLLIVQRALGLANLLDLLPIPALDWFVALMAVVYVSLFAGSLILSQVIQTAYLISRFSNRSRVLLGIWIALMVIWTSLRAIPIVSELFAWLPPATFANVASVGDIYAFTTTYLDTGPFAATILVTIAMIILAGYAVDGLRKSQRDGEFEAPPPPTSETPQPIGPAGSGLLGRSRYARRPARLPNFRERVLIIVLAASALIVYDLFSGGLAVTSNPGAIFARPALTTNNLRGFYQDRPFLAKRGSIELPRAGINVLTVNAIGDIELFGHDDDTVVVDYVIRAYGDSAQHSQELYDRVDVKPLQDGDQLTIQAVIPSREDSSSVRGSYQVRVPKDMEIHINSEESVIYIHDVIGRLRMDLSNTSLFTSQVSGELDVTGVGTDIALIDSVGDLDIDLTDGVLEAHGLEGHLRVSARDGSVDASGLVGGVTASLHRGFALIRGVQGPVEIKSTMAHIEVGYIDGDVTVDGVMSPINLFNLSHDATVITDRGNVFVSVSDESKWQAHVELERATLIDDELDRNNVQVSTGPVTSGAPEIPRGEKDPASSQLVVRARRANVTII